MLTWKLLNLERSSLILAACFVLLSDILLISVLTKKFVYNYLSCKTMMWWHTIFVKFKVLMQFLPQVRMWLYIFCLFRGSSFHSTGVSTSLNWCRIYRVLCRSALWCWGTCLLSEIRVKKAEATYSVSKLLILWVLQDQTAILSLLIMPRCLRNMTTLTTDALLLIGSVLIWGILVMAPPHNSVASSFAGPATVVDSYKSHPSTLLVRKGSV